MTQKSPCQSSYQETRTITLDKGVGFKMIRTVLRDDMKDGEYLLYTELVGDKKVFHIGIKPGA
jgi:hypothetical protein